MSQVLDFKKSRSGRLLIPRLKHWTGERIIVTKRGNVEVLHGVPDCTSSFESERTLYKTAASGLSHSLHLCRTSNTPLKTLTRSLNLGTKSRSTSAKRKKSIERAKLKVKKSNANVVKVSPPKISRRSRSSEKGPDAPTDAISLSQKQSEKLRKRKTNNITKTRTPSPRKNLRKQPNPEQDEDEVDIYGPNFQPFVLMVRLLPEEILSLTAVKEKLPEKPTSPNQQPEKVSKSTLKAEKSKQKRSSQPNLSETPSRNVAKRRQPRTVRETQEMLRLVSKPKERKEVEDEAASTAAFFGNIPCRAATMQVNEAMQAMHDILNDDLEVDDNLSIRSMGESSPMSTAVSPIGSINETDAEMSGREDGLLMDSPALGSASSFQRAKMVHRVLKNKSKLTRITKARKKEEASLPSQQSPIKRLVPSVPNNCQLLQPLAIRAIEKDLKRKVKNGQQWDFSSIHNGVYLHVSVNSDSESDQSSVDSLDEF